MTRILTCLALTCVACGPPDSTEPPESLLDHGMDMQPVHEGETDAGKPSANQDAAIESNDDAGLGPTSGPDAFADAGPFVDMAAPSRAHGAAEASNPTRSACLSCHHQGGDSPLLLAGGTLFLDAALTSPGADCEVRVVDTSSGRAFSTRSDERGNFWIAAPDPYPTGPFLMGARNARTQRTMPVLQYGLDCNGTACHGGAQGPILLLP